MLKLTKSGYVVSMVKALLISYLVTAVLLMLLALGMYKLGLSTGLVGICITFVYIFAASVGGLIIGKKVKQKKFLWGMAMGVLYAAVIFAVALLMGNDGARVVQDGVSTAMLCVSGGLLGGMIS